MRATPLKAQSQAALARVWVAVEALLRYVFGRDIFISYSRADGGKYAPNLVLALQAKRPKLSCYLDKWIAPPNSELPPSLQHQLRWSGLLVLICTEHAVASEFVRKEIRLFSQSGRAVVPIDVDRYFYKLKSDSDIWKNIGGASPEDETAAAVRSGNPSDPVVDRILKAIEFTTQDERLRQAVWGTLLLTVSLIGAAVLYSTATVGAARRAAQSATLQAEHEAAVAASRSLANRSETLLRERPEDLLRSTALALSAMQKSLDAGVRTIEADTALRDDLAVLPNLKRSERFDEDGYLTVANLSPDGRYFGLVSQGKRLRIFESWSETPLSARSPVREVACNCSQIALSSGLRSAVGVTPQGIRVVEFKEPVRSHLVPIRGKVSPFPEMTLSPGGRYLAMTFDTGGGTQSHKIMRVFATSDGQLVKQFDDPTLSIDHLAFGPGGDLAATGERKDGERTTRAAIRWQLPLRAESGETERQLTEASFNTYEVISQSSAAHAIGPGFDTHSFATGEGLWERVPGNAGYSAITRFPYFKSGAHSSILKVATSADGKTITLLRGVSGDTQNQNDLDEDDLEVWDSFGYTAAFSRFESGEGFDGGSAKKSGL